MNLAGTPKLGNELIELIAMRRAAGRDLSAIADKAPANCAADSSACSSHEYTHRTYLLKRITPENFTRDDDALDLARPLGDVVALCIAVIALDREIPHITITPMDGDCVITHLERHFCCVILCHCRLELDGHGGIEHSRG